MAQGGQGSSTAKQRAEGAALMATAPA